MRIRFQADNDLNKSIVRAVIRREPSIDFRSAQSARLDGMPDPEVLLDSARTGRILVSHDYQTMPEHFREFTLDHHSPGVFLIPQHLPVLLAVDALILVWAATDPGEWEDKLCLIPSLVTIAVGSKDRPLA